MTNLNARVEGFARDQLALGRTERQVVQSLVRLGHIEREAAVEMVARIARALAARARRRFRTLIATGLTLAVSSIVLQLAAGPLFQSQILTLPLALLGAAICYMAWRDQRRSKPVARPDVEPDGINPRLAGFARQQLMQGRGSWWIIDEMVRHQHVDKAEAARIVERVKPSILGASRGRGRRAFVFGLLILAIPLSIVGTFVFGWIFIPGGMPRSPFSEIAKMFLYLPMVFIEVLGVALVVSGWSAMKRSKNNFVPDGPSGPASTGLWWRADPFEWK